MKQGGERDKVGREKRSGKWREVEVAKDRREGACHGRVCLPWILQTLWIGHPQTTVFVKRLIDSPHNQTNAAIAAQS